MKRRRTRREQPVLGHIARLVAEEHKLYEQSALGGGPFRVGENPGGARTSCASVGRDVNSAKIQRGRTYAHRKS